MGRITTFDAVKLGIPRWMVLAMPDDVTQIVALVNLEYHTPRQRKTALNYYLKCLRRNQWDREPRKQVSKPAALRPSKIASGYRTDSTAHQKARLKVNQNTRSNIARMGAVKRKENGRDSSAIVSIGKASHDSAR